MSNTNWKSVYKELPEDFTIVLVTVSTLIPYVTVAQYSSRYGKWFWPSNWIKNPDYHGEITDGKVIAWQPLPKPYK